MMISLRDHKTEDFSHKGITHSNHLAQITDAIPVAATNATLIAGNEPFTLPF